MGGSRWTPGRCASPCRHRKGGGSRPGGVLPRIAGALAISALLLAGCTESDGSPTAPIDVDRFVAVYVDLRAAALVRADGELPPRERDRILDEHGVEAEDLVEFVEVHGEDIRFMDRVWAEVESRLAERRAEYDEEAEGASPDEDPPNDAADPEAEPPELRP